MKTFKYIETETFEQNFVRWKELTDLDKKWQHIGENQAYISFRRRWGNFKKKAANPIPYIYGAAPSLCIDSNRIDCQDGDFQVWISDENGNDFYSDIRVIVRDGLFDLTTALCAHKELIDRGILHEDSCYFEGISFVRDKGALEIHTGS